MPLLFCQILDVYKRQVLSGASLLKNSNGTRQIAVTHSIPNTPIEFLSSDAPDSTVSVASEITPPTLSLIHICKR